MAACARPLMGCVAMALCCSPLTAVRGQHLPATLVGVVRDSAGAPILGVEVRVYGGPLVGRTDDSGTFRIMGLPSGVAQVRLRRMGFLPTVREVRLLPGRTDSLAVSLTALATMIPGVTVQEEHEARSHRLLPGFWERRARGFGYFLTRDQIEKRNAFDFAELTRMAPGVTIGMRNGRKTIRFRRGGEMTDCPPQFVVDGMRIENGSPDEFEPGDVEALELYSGPATIPPQYAPRFDSHTCGAVVIWTRLPGA